MMQGADRHTALKRAVLPLAGLVLLLAAWQVLSMRTHSIVLASPAETFAELASMAGRAAFWRDLWMSFRRMAGGIFIGGASGFLMGLAAGMNRTVRYLLEPLRWTLMSVPAVVVVVLAMLWFGVGSSMVVFLAGLLLSPIVYINTVRGLDMVDDAVLEMARIYRFGTVMTVRHVYIPAITAPLVSGLVLAVGMAVRIVILAEVMGTSDGIGHALSLARSSLDIPALYAWVIVSIAIVGVIEYGVLKPLEERVMRWRR